MVATPSPSGSLVVIRRSGSIAVIIPAAGSGRRFGAVHNKLFAALGGKPVWLHSVEKMLAREEVAHITLAISDDDHRTFVKQFDEYLMSDRVRLCPGGAERSDSVACALATFASDPAIEYVAVHDAARPLVKPSDLTAVFAAAQQSGAAILATPITGTVKRCPTPFLSSTMDRRELWTALTPQVFSVALLRSAYARHRGRPATDDAELVERSGHPVSIVAGSPDNLKITFPEDLTIAEAILKQHAEQP